MNPIVIEQAQKGFYWKRNQFVKSKIESSNATGITLSISWDGPLHA